MRALSGRDVPVRIQDVLRGGTGVELLITARRFVERAARHPELSKLHDLRTRTSGNQDFAQFHVNLPAAMTVGEAPETYSHSSTAMGADNGP